MFSRSVLGDGGLLVTFSFVWSLPSASSSLIELILAFPNDCDRLIASLGEPGKLHAVRSGLRRRTWAGDDWCGWLMVGGFWQRQ